MPTTQAHQHLTIRRSETNPNHHLWNNNGTWWLHFTLRSANGTKKRHRHSLKTRDLELARLRRNGILNDLQAKSGRIVL